MTDHLDPLIRTALEEGVPPLPPLDDGWPDVLLRTERRPVARPRRSKGGRWLIQRRPLVIGAVLVPMAAVAVCVAALGPWVNGPSLVERAAAAISPGDDVVLHIRETQRVNGSIATTETWQFGDPLRSLRIARSDAAGPVEDRSITVATRGTAPDGAAWLRGSSVSYCPADGTLRTLSDTVTSFSANVPIGALPNAVTPNAQIAAALESGALHPIGDATVQGEDVVAFTGVMPGAPTGEETRVTYYAATGSLAPVRVEWTDTSGAGQGTRNSIDFDAVEQLPATPQNRQLLNVAAGHPGALSPPASGVAGQCL